MTFLNAVWYVRNHGYKICYLFDLINLIKILMTLLGNNLDDKGKDRNRNCYKTINLTQNGPSGSSKSLPNSRFRKPSG